MNRGEAGKRIIALLIRSAIFAVIMVVALVIALIMLLCGVDGYLVLALVYGSGVLSWYIGDRVVQPRSIIIDR
jgi:uncharacterized RDD family membrane protein YckC